MRLASTLILTLLIAALACVPAGGGTQGCNAFTIEESKYATPFGVVEPSVDGSVIWAVRADRAYRSADYGANWATVKIWTRGDDANIGLFVDSNDNLFFGRGDVGKLIKGVWAGGDSLTCTDVLTYDCSDCPAGICSGFWHMAEDSSGNLYVGEYNGQMADTCAIIWKSEDSGDNWTRIRWSQGDRHVHFCAVNPADDALYVSIGDGAGRRRILKSIDAGASFTTIHNTSAWSQPISFAFTDAGRIFGSDAVALTNGIYRTWDDATFRECYTFSGAEDAFVWCMTEDPNGNLIAGTKAKANGQGNDANDVRLYASEDGGETWCSVRDEYNHDDGTGYHWLSQRFDDEGYGYFVVTQDDGVGDDAYRFRVIHTPHRAPPVAALGGRGGTRGGRR